MDGEDGEEKSNSGDGIQVVKEEMEDGISKPLQQKRAVMTMPKFICDQCGHCFTRKSTLNLHMMNTHTGPVKPFACDVCSLTFVQSGTMKRHKREVHGTTKRQENEVHTHVCRLCGKSFKRETILRRHTMVHAGFRPFECKVCHKRFSQAGNCKEHMKAVHGRLEFVCEVCDKAYSRLSYLTKHQALHQLGTIRFQCDQCKRPFARKDHLKTHTEKIHNKKNRLSIELDHHYRHDSLLPVHQTANNDLA